MATAIRAAIRPYSIAVAPDSSLAKFLMKLRMMFRPCFLSEQQFHHQGHRLCPLDPRLHEQDAPTFIKGEENENTFSNLLLVTARLLNFQLADAEKQPSGNLDL